MMKSLLNLVEQRSGILADDTFLSEVLSDLIKFYPSLKNCYGDFDSWTWFYHQGMDMETAINAYGDDWTDNDGYVRLVAYEEAEDGGPATEKPELGRAMFNLTMMQNALQGATLWD